MRVVPALVVLVCAAVPAMAQTPQPFPRPGGAPQQRPAPPPPRATQPPPTPAAPQASAAPADPSAPPASEIVFPVYPTAQFIASYDAGRGQRYYLFGTTAGFVDMVAYYRTQLDEDGDLIFEAPATHMFEVGRFRNETMAFPPGVTVKDWTFGGSQGYPNPRPGATPARFPTVIMIVPPPR